MNTKFWSAAEEVSAHCREIYSRYGYRPYKMSRFEEYDLYAANKNFLIGENIITFTEPSGRLMALKPDVTISIVKNAECRRCAQDKVFYLENVYRTAKNSSDFKEIMQLGLECIGDVGRYQTGEVISLAARSLAVISGDYILDVSHMGFICGLADAAGIPESRRGELIKYIGGRNAADVTRLCSECAAGGSESEKLVSLTGIYGAFGEALPKLEALSVNEKTAAALHEVRGIFKILTAMGVAERVNLDFAQSGDMDYYNGITFSGYISGIPTAVLSGGRYDSLLERFGKSGGAVGFAIYLDLLDAIPEEKREFDLDVLLVCGGDTDGERTARAVEKLTAAGRNVMALGCVPESKIRCREVINLDDIIPEESED